MSSQNHSTSRRSMAYVSSLGTRQLHLRSPWVTAFWSAMFPGFGHLLLLKFLRGFLLFIWEVYININAHINVAILYSFTGRFNDAKNILDTRWMLLYIPTYLFAIWDSYRTAADLNNQYILAAWEDPEIKAFKIDALEINYLDKKSPWSSVAWSFLMPGTGQLSIHRIIFSFFILSWWIAIVYYSKILPAIHLTFMGSFAEAKSVLDVQWALDIPSFYFYSVYDAYINTVESNKLFDHEQAKFLEKEYQAGSFSMPFEKNSGSDNMYVVSTFEHSISLEKAIISLEVKGIEKQAILAIPMEKKFEGGRLFDTINQSDGLSLLDLPFIIGAFLTLMGGIYGFILPWGPLIWGLIGLVAGFGIGLAIKLITVRKRLKGAARGKVPDVVLIIECKEQQTEMVQDVLWSYKALGVRKLK